LIKETAMAIRSNKGFHSVVNRDHSYITIDSCMQAWPDAEYDKANLHGITAYTVTAMRPYARLAQALEELMFWHLTACKHRNIVVVSRADDIPRAKQEGKAALILAAQNGEFLENKLHRIEAFYGLGLRLMIPAYNAGNHICGGCLDRVDQGVTRFGYLVIDECNRVGLVLDCTHVGRISTMEIIERSNQPVIFSHSNPVGVVDSPRNIEDRAIEICAEKGGVIGLVAWGPLVLKRGQTEWPSVDDFVDHIDYVADLLGSTSSIGIGTDLSLGSYPYHQPDPWGVPAYPKFHEEYGRLITADVRSPMRALRDFNDYSEIVNVIDRLSARGYSEDDISGILGGNFLRLFRQVWK
jgi:membrane dipeptidase